MIQARPPAGDACKPKGKELTDADVRGMYDTMRFALTRAELAAEGRPQKTIHVILNRRGVRWTNARPGAREFAYTPRCEACVVKVYSASFSDRADTLLTRWNALMLDVESAVLAQLDAAGVAEDRFLVARGDGPLGLFLLDLLGMSDDEKALVERVFPGNGGARSRAFLKSRE